VTASQARHLSTFTSASRINVLRGAHTLRFGVDVQYFPVSENFSFAITDPGFNHPGDEGFNPSLLVHDLTRGGSLFHFSGKASGTMYSAFFQDQVRWNRFVLSLGARYDRYRFLIRGNQLQPRTGLAFHIRETATVLRASYNRTYQTPPNENLLMASSASAALLAPPAVRDQLGGALLHIRPERQNVYEAGIQQALFGRVSADLVYYHKNSTDLQDNDNFFNTGLIFPTSLARSRVNGVEGRIVVPQLHGFSGSLSLNHYHAVVTPPFTGGLFLGNEAVEALTSGPFIIDHDQKLASHGVLTWKPRRGFWTSWSVRHDSGLVAGDYTPEEVALDPDYAALLPYVNLESDPPRVRPRTITDFSVGYERLREGRRTWDLQFTVSNLTNKTALYNFRSIFVGTRLVQPRTAGLKLRFFF
jgi:hypothetical protein